MSNLSVKAIPSVAGMSSKRTALSFNVSFLQVMRLHLFIALTLLAVVPAHAHGEEVLVSFYAQAIAVVACFVGLQIAPFAKPHRLSGSIACMAGVVLAEFVVSNVPYNDNQVVITMAMVILPIMATAGSVLIGRSSAKHNAKT